MTEAVEVHATAVVQEGAELGIGVKLAPYAVVHPTARVGDGSEIGSFAVVGDHTTLGAETRVFPHATVGSDPQDLKYDGETTWLEVGDRNVFREFVTINRGTAGGGGVTRIGSDNLFMAYCHIAHDCQVGDHTIFGNAATLAGHVEIGSWAILNAFCAAQQFARIGDHAYVAAYAGAKKDVVPFARVHGNPARVIGLNTIGLRRRGFADGTRKQLKQAFRTLFNSKLNTTQGLEALAKAGLDAAEVEQLVSFIEASKLGIIK